MAKKKVPATKSRKLSACQEQIQDAMAELRKALASVGNLKPKADRESVEADLCLASRSAYFDFYTWLVIHGTVDVPAEQDLNELFQRSIELMAEGRFKKSVQSRYKDFKKECEHVRGGSQSFELSSEQASSFQA